MIKCRICDKDVAPNAAKCPHCGADDPNIKNFKLRYGGGGAAFFLFGLFLAGKALYNHQSSYIAWGICIVMIVVGAVGMYIGITGKEDLD